MFDQEFLKKWTAELRSGNRKQAKGYLRTAEGFCCLGVACDLIDPDGWDDCHLSRPGWTHRETGDREVTLIPLLLAESLGFHVGLKSEDMDKFQSWFAEKNDDGYTFPEIADELERVFLEKS